MHKIDEFGHVLAIAFSVSAIFYYIDFRVHATARFEQALGALETARHLAEQKVKDLIKTAIDVDIGSQSIVSLRPRSAQAQKVLDELAWQQNVATLRWSFLGGTASLVSYSHAITHVLAILSTAVSLGSLVYSGFHPHDEYSWQIISLILVASFLSIIWNLCLYLLLLPKLTKAVAKPSTAEGLQ